MSNCSSWSIHFQNFIHDYTLYSSSLDLELSHLGLSLFLLFLQQLIIDFYGNKLLLLLM
ncbi:uncharacterized protein DS421_20g701020 [Arachis hypogaea]|nr:uncharacterized protein DS421_20g701020 [Arachis hypogaea]